MASSPACRPFFSGASSPTASAVAPLATSGSPLASAHDALPPPSLDLSSDAVACALALFHEMKMAGDLVLACVVVRIQSCPRSPLWCPSAPTEQDLLPAMSAQVALQIDDLFERSLQGGSQVCKSICLMFNAHLAGAKESDRPGPASPKDVHPASTSTSASSSRSTKAGRPTGTLRFGVPRPAPAFAALPQAPAAAVPAAAPLVVLPDSVDEGNDDQPAPKRARIHRRTDAQIEADRLAKIARCNLEPKMFYGASAGNVVYVLGASPICMVSACVFGVYLILLAVVPVFVCFLRAGTTPKK